MRKLFNPVMSVVLSAVILKIGEFIWLKVGGPDPLETLWQTFVVEMWPMWVGLTIGGVHWFVRFLLRIELAADRSLQISASLVNRLNAERDKIT
jgi:hypothetical protein